MRDQSPRADRPDKDRRPRARGWVRSSAACRWRRRPRRAQFWAGSSARDRERSRFPGRRRGISAPHIRRSCGLRESRPDAARGEGLEVLAGQFGVGNGKKLFFDFGLGAEIAIAKDGGRSSAPATPAVWAGVPRCNARVEKYGRKGGKSAGIRIQIGPAHESLPVRSNGICVYCISPERIPRPPTTQRL